MSMQSLLLVAWLAAPATAGPDCEAVASELLQMRRQLVAQELHLKERAEQIDSLGRELRAMGQEMGGLRERMTPSVAGPFLSGPPTSSDSVGVAKVAVFAP